MELLAEINIKLEKKEIIYEGDNASLREQKLKEVRNEYEKKYKMELDSYIRSQNNFGEQSYTLEYIKNYCYNLYQKYDGLISK
jgi:mevalonate pyrophosphate decarboxylase